jgi:hypothetical protein
LNWVSVWNGSGQQRRRVEDAAEEDQRLQHEGLRERDVVELLGAHADEHAELREEEADEEQRRDQHERVLDGTSTSTTRRRR